MVRSGIELRYMCELLSSREEPPTMESTFMKHASAIFLMGILGLASYGGAHAQAVPGCTLSGCTISTSGSYILNGNIAGLTITSNDVSVDLNGFTVAQNPAGSISCTIVANVAGNSCTT